MGALSDVYDARVRAGEMRDDVAQREIMALFDDIHAALSKPAKSGLLSLIGGLKRPEAAKGLYLWGGVGRGKSMMMDLFYEHAPVKARRVHFHEFMQEVQAELHKARAAGTEDALGPMIAQIAAEVRLLCFDEMQITDIADAMIVGRLFEGLFEAGVTVVTTSNRVPDDLYKDGLNRQLFLPFIALIKEKLTVKEITSETDYRQGRLTGKTVYFSPLGPQATAQMDAIWMDLTGGATESLTLTVKKRKLALPKFHNGVARAQFWDLCGQMYGPGDYLAIAEACKVLLIDDVPQLSKENFNEAKRFVTLIDALYEAQVKVIISGFAEPEQLYLTGSGAFEFERTASRLREMQDATWGQA